MNPARGMPFSRTDIKAASTRGLQEFKYCSTVVPKKTLSSEVACRFPDSAWNKFVLFEFPNSVINAPQK
jgi:hypothetical protein